jgi:hypothetical protein
MAEHGIPSPAGDEEVWKRKVRSVDDTLKSLRSGGPGSKQPRAKRPQPAKEPHRGLFSFQRPRVVPPPIPIDPNPLTE